MAVVRAARVLARSGVQLPVAAPSVVLARSISTTTRNEKAPTDLILRFANASSQRKLHHITSMTLALGIPMALVSPGPVASTLDWVLGVAIPIHAHSGMRSVFLDYMPHLGVTDKDMQQILIYLLGAVTVTTMLAIAKLNATDIGLTGSIKRLWIRRPAAVEDKEERA